MGGISAPMSALNSITCSHARAATTPRKYDAEHPCRTFAVSLVQPVRSNALVKVPWLHKVVPDVITAFCSGWVNSKCALHEITVDGQAAFFLQRCKLV